MSVPKPEYFQGMQEGAVKLTGGGGHPVRCVRNRLLGNGVAESEVA